MLHVLRRKINSFGHAFRGVGLMLRDYNTAIHLPAGLAVVAMAWWLEVAKTDWLWLLWCIGIMWIMETVNTAIEKTVDLACRRRKHPLAKMAKDIAAAAVLLALCFSALTGIIILGPPLWLKIKALLPAG